MTLKAQVASDVADVFLNTDDFAEAVTYAGTAISAIVDREPIIPQTMEDGFAEVDWVVVHAAVSDVAAPARGDAVVITALSGVGTESYRVDSWEGDHGMWILRCVTLDERELHGGNRMRRV